MIRTVVLMLVGLVAAADTAPAAPGSFYSTQGLGLRRHFPNTRSLGLGGIGLALNDPQALSALNPALLARVQLTRLSISFLHETSGATSALESGRVTDSNVTGAQFFVPLGKETGFGAGIRPYTVIDYAFMNEGKLSDVDFVERLSGEGGVTTAFVGFAFGVGGRLQLGVRGNAYFGRTKRVWEVSYASTEFAATRDEISGSIRGYGFTLGAVLNASSRWQIGAVLSPGFKLTSETELSSRSGADLPERESEYQLPMEYGFGSVLNPVGRLLVGADVLIQRWSQFKVDGAEVPGWEDAFRIGVGAELGGNPNAGAGLFERLSYRVGAYYARLGLQVPDGKSVDEIFGTAGLGVPFNGNRGRIDVAVQFGSRGSRPDNPLKENIWRIAISVSGGERWFIQRR